MVNAMLRNAKVAWNVLRSRSKDSATARQAARRLGALGDRRAIPALVAILHSARPDLLDEANQALMAVATTKEERVAEYEKVLALSSSSGVDNLVIKSLAALEDRTADSLLIEQTPRRINILDDDTFAAVVKRLEQASSGAMPQFLKDCFHFRYIRAWAPDKLTAQLVEELISRGFQDLVRHTIPNFEDYKRNLFTQTIREMFRQKISDSYLYTDLITDVNIEKAKRVYEKFGDFTVILHPAECAEGAYGANTPSGSHEIIYFPGPVISDAYLEITDPIQTPNK